MLFYKEKLLLLILILFSINKGKTQNKDVSIQNLLNTNILHNNIYTSIVKNIYQKIGYQYIWFNNNTATNILQDIYIHSDNLGLNKEDYKLIFFTENKIHSIKNKWDTINAEIKLTYTVVQFMHDYIFGNTVPNFGYNGLVININSADIITNKLIDLITQNKITFSNLLINKNTLPEVNAIESMINKLTAINKYKTITDDNIKSNKLSLKNTSLINKLIQLGILDTIKEIISDSLLKQKIIEAQILFNQPLEFKISNRLRIELNVKISERIKRLKVSLNYYKWLYWILMNSNEPVILINIPNTKMSVYNKKYILLEMKMVLGKYSSKTPTLTSRINNVILYPYWHVPYSIATKELLPKIKRNTSYLYGGNYQVLNSTGKIVDPNKINWQSLNRYYFPYTIRQSTGCDNSLGLIKLDFENPFGVYIHDTPSKNYFEEYRRYFSHGCMRMENPIEISKILLGKNHIAIDTLIEQGCLLNKSPVLVKAEIKSPVIVWYNLSGIDKSGKVVFYEDIYKNEMK